VNVNGPVLRDIHLPSAAWWPPAPGWWALAGMILLAAVVLVWWAARHARQGRLRTVLREIDVLAATYARDGDDVRLADRASRLLRRIAHDIDPVLASQSGEAWRAFVHSHAKDAAVREALDDLIDARFRPRPVLDAAVLFAALRTWCADTLRMAAARRLAVSRSGAAAPAERGTVA
jgi:Domain of unknown function (DUF4381)